jgi:hypothetical protein
VVEIIKTGHAPKAFLKVNKVKPNKEGTVVLK